MDDKESRFVSLDEINIAYENLKKCPKDWFRRTPMLIGVQNLFNFGDEIQLSLKLENTQVTGSFKVRGAIPQLKCIPEGYGTEDHKLISISAGNYGKAFAYFTNKMGLKGHIILPVTAPDNREEVIKSYGVDVERLPVAELMNGVERHCREDGMLFVHSFDDINLIIGYGSVGLEILEDMTDPDIVLVCCGGGALLAGTAAAIKLSGHQDCKIYGVEPEGSRTMYESYKTGKPIGMPVKSVASGLSPPCAGTSPYHHCRKYVEDILLVTDEEILTAMFTLYKTGLLVEPSGAAAFASLYHGKVPDATGKKIVVVITGGNVTPQELVEYSKIC